MNADIPQHILDALTDVEMPRLKSEPEMTGLVEIPGHAVPTYASGALVVGSGAAGLRAAVELRRRGVKDRKSTRLNSSHSQQSRMPSSA